MSEDQSVPDNLIDYYQDIDWFPDPASLQDNDEEEGHEEGEDENSNWPTTDKLMIDFEGSWLTKACTRPPKNRAAGDAKAVRLPRPGRNW